VVDAVAESPLHEPYETHARQKEAVVFGLWTFLASELLLFGGLFLAYAVYRWTHTTAFNAAAHHTNELYGTLNTAWLLTSSAAIAIAGRVLERGQVKTATVLIWVTIAFGLLFLGTKALEYKEDLEEHLWPGPNFALVQPAARAFFSLYWVMTGVHAVHVTVGLCLIARLAVMAHVGTLARRVDSVEATSLYWHLVDAIWVVLFPCLYLVGR
jgi:cytochrome c oxidase subunit III